MPSGIYIRTKPRGPVSEETRKKMSAAKRGKPGNNKGCHWSEEVRMKMGAKNKGKSASLETRKKMSKAKKGQNHPMFGKYHTDDTKNKMSASAKNRPPCSEETRRKMRKIAKERKFGKWMEGKSPSSETRNKIRKTLKGHSVSEETRRKIRVAHFNVPPRFEDTSIEVKVQNILKENNIKFKTQRSIAGHPDIFIEPNICIFCDGNYWHANPKKYAPNSVMHGGRLAKQIWERDNQNTKELQKQGYVVLRFWEEEINNSISKCFNTIKEYACGRIQSKNCKY